MVRRSHEKPVPIRRSPEALAAPIRLHAATAPLRPMIGQVRCVRGKTKHLCRVIHARSGALHSKHFGVRWLATAFVVAVLLNFVWEMAQAYLYHPMGTVWEATRRCEHWR